MAKFPGKKIGVRNKVVNGSHQILVFAAAEILLTFNMKVMVLNIQPECS